MVNTHALSSYVSMSNNILRCIFWERTNLKVNILPTLLQQMIYIIYRYAHSAFVGKNFEIFATSNSMRYIFAFSVSAVIP